MAVQLTEAGTVPASTMRLVSVRQRANGGWRAYYRDAQGFRREAWGATREQALARGTAILAGTQPARSVRPNGTGGGFRQRGPSAWEARYRDAEGVQRYVYGPTPESVEAKLAAHVEQVRRDAVTLDEWTSLKACKPRRPAAEAIITRTALLQLVRAVEGYLAGDTVDCLDLPMAAAYGALGADGRESETPAAEGAEPPPRRRGGRGPPGSYLMDEK